MKAHPTRVAVQSTSRSRSSTFLPLLLVLLGALALRVLLWNHIPRTGLISDEGEYLSAATWLAEGRGFSWYSGYLWTRAPLYPLLLAAHLRFFGSSLAPIYITQNLLSLLNIALVYALARRLFPDQRAVPLLAAVSMAIYFPFALYTQVLLSETVFISLLLGAFLALTIWAEIKHVNAGHRSGFVMLVLAGIGFGLATLTRSLTLAFLPLAALWVGVVARDLGAWWRPTWSGVRSAALLLVCAGAIVLPWTLYNSLRLYGGLIVVDTTGAFNLMLGARTAYDGQRSDAPTRNFALALLDQNLAVEQRQPLVATQAGRDAACLLQRNDPQLLTALSRPVGTAIPQARTQQLMTAEGVCLIAARPLAFVQKSLAELVDLFQINYGGDERFADGFTLGRLPRWYALALFLLDDTMYVLALPLAVIGWGITRGRPKAKDGEPRIEALAATNRSVVGHSSLVSLIGLWWLYNIGVAPLLFAINRFRLPLLPFAFIFAAYALVRLLQGGWRSLRWIYAVPAMLLFLIAATPYAYFEPRAPGLPSTWASYLGPRPSALESTVTAWQARPSYVAEQQIRQALGAGDSAMARTQLADDAVSDFTRRIAQPLLDGLEGKPDDGLTQLAEHPPLSAVEAAVVRGDLLRRKGDWKDAKSVLGQTLIDNANPVQFAWDWLHPVALPGNHIDVAGDLDLGYIEGCYLGEGDPAANGTFRWCGDGARLRFPQAGTGAPQTLALRVDARGWASFAPAAPPVQIFVNEQSAGSFTPDTAKPIEATVALPATAVGEDVVITLRSASFVPDAARYLSQQGKGVVGQVQRLAVRLDWAELR